MAEYTLAHIGVNAENEEEAMKIAETFQLLFGWEVKPGNSSVFAGTEIEVMKKDGRGTHGHIGVGTPDIQAAMADLEAKGFTFDPSSAKYKPDGTMNAIYLTGEYFGFAVHLVKI